MVKVRVLLGGAVVVAALALLSSCGLLGSDTPPAASTQMGGPAFNNAGDNGPMVLLTVVVVVVLFAAGAMGAALFRAWRDERAELRAELRRYAHPEFPGRRGAPELNGEAYGYRAPVDYRDYKRIGR